MQSPSSGQLPVEEVEDVVSKVDDIVEVVDSVDVVVAVDIVVVVVVDDEEEAESYAHVAQFRLRQATIYTYSSGCTMLMTGKPFEAYLIVMVSFLAGPQFCQLDAHRNE